ncbi:MAG: hypothetical protein M3308_03685 [Actinomycetota bacterium]|nr:hypothetical protein [Actinomycetota bacterium]
MTVQGAARGVVPGELYPGRDPVAVVLGVVEGLEVGDLHLPVDVGQAQAGGGEHLRSERPRP